LISAEKARETALNTTKTQLTRETERSRAKFRRGQQQIAYATGSTHSKQLYDLAQQLNAQLSRKTPSAERIALISDKMRATYYELLGDETQIELVGSPETRSSWEEVVKRQQDLRGWLAKHISAALNDNDATFTEDKFLSYIVSVLAANRKFAEQAADLGNR
jgi:hypothetical protein